MITFSMICAYVLPLIAFIAIMLIDKYESSSSKGVCTVVGFISSVLTYSNFMFLVMNAWVAALIYTLMPIAMILLPVLAVVAYRKTRKLQPFLEAELPRITHVFIGELIDAIAQLWQRSGIKQRTIGYQARKYRAEIQDATTDANTEERRMADNVVKAVSAFRARKAQIAKDIRAIKRDLRRFRRRDDADKTLMDSAKQALAQLRVREKMCDDMIQFALDWLDLVEEPLRLSRYQSVDMEQFNARYEQLMSFAKSIGDELTGSPALESILAKAMSDPAVLAEIEGGERALERVREKAREVALPDTEGGKKKASGRRAQTV